MPDDIIARTGGADIDEMLPEMTDLYREIYAEPPYNSGPLFEIDAFQARTRRQAARDGFTLVTARTADATMIGFAFGVPFAAGQWWSGEATPPPADILSAPKFAVIELVVRHTHRGHGIGRKLLTTLLVDRPEPYAFLTAFPDAPAREVYRRWGWTQVGTAHHTPDSPILDSLVLPL
jgi:GNAT superfamily N-acetyltransferase